MSTPRHAARLRRFHDVDLYPVTSQALTPRHTTLELVDAVVAGGARIVQLREKELNQRELHGLAVEVRRRTAVAGVLLVINDHLDIALAVDADAVHLGQDDLPLAVARRLAPDVLICASTHDRAELQRAQQDGADVVNLGPLFATGTKPHLTAPLGMVGLQALMPLAHVPFTVMGGIKREHLAALRRAGVSRVAMVTAITQATDPAQATRELCALLQH